MTAEAKILLAAAAPSRTGVVYIQETAWDSREQMNQAGWLSELLWGSGFSELGRVRRSNAQMLGDADIWTKSGHSLILPLGLGLSRGPGMSAPARWAGRLPFSRCGVPLTFGKGPWT